MHSCCRFNRLVDVELTSAGLQVRLVIQLQVYGKRARDSCDLTQAAGYRGVLLGVVLVHRQHSVVFEVGHAPLVLLHSHLKAFLQLLLGHFYLGTVDEELIEPCSDRQLVLQGERHEKLSEVNEVRPLEVDQRFDSRWRIGRSLRGLKPELRKAVGHAEGRYFVSLRL